MGDSIRDRRGGARKAWSTREKRTILSVFKEHFNNKKAIKSSKSALFKALCNDEDIKKVCKGRDLGDGSGMKTLVLKNILGGMKRVEDDMHAWERDHPKPKKPTSGDSGDTWTEYRQWTQDSTDKRDELYEEHLNSHMDVLQDILDIFGAESTHCARGMVYDTRDVPVSGRDQQCQSRMQRVVRSQTPTELNKQHEHETAQMIRLRMRAVLLERLDKLENRQPPELARG